MSIDRRNFIKATAAAPLMQTSAKGASKRRTALIGTGWWGMNICREAVAAGQSQIVAMCDVDENQLEPAHAEIVRLSGDQPKKYRDYRELIAAEKPEICIVATPDHWHPLCTIEAVNNGAHVYVEKPIGHTVNEGKAMVAAARRNDRVVQVGTHRRVSPHNVSGMEFLRSGKAGKIGMVRCFVHSARTPGATSADAEIPKGLDWEMWCGPAPYRSYNPAIHPKGFRNFGDYANGTIGDWGIHWFDQVLWWTEERMPKRIFSSGARHLFDDHTDTPDTQVATFEFESFTCTWEHRWYAGNDSEKTRIGCYFYGSEGVFHMGWRDGWTFYPAKASQKPIHDDPTFHEPDTQNIRELWADFLEAINRGRRPACDIEIGHRATAMSLLATISQRTGRSLEWEPQNQRIVGDPEANRLLERKYRPPWEYPRA